MTVSGLNSPQARPSVSQKIKMVNDLGTAVFETEHATKDGRILPIEVHAKTLTYNNRPAIIAVCRDLSEARRVNELEAQSAANEDNFRIIFDSVGDAIFILPRSDVYGKNFLEVNRTACEKFGYGRDEFLKMSPRTSRFCRRTPTSKSCLKKGPTF